MARTINSKVNFNAPLNTAPINVSIPVTFNFNAPLIDLSGLKVETSEEKPAEESPIEKQIFDEIVRKFGVRRESLVSCTRFPSCYEQYAVGTTGDVTFVAWKHCDGSLHIQRQIW